ncbi:MAG: 50S ribosomal protein L23 [Planctomycetota bacterium]
MAVPVPPPPALNPRLEPAHVILRPLVTEKGMHRANRNNAYSFEVAMEATKADVRRAVEELFNVKVEKVAIQNRRGKVRRGRMRKIVTKPWKKAIVTLSAESKINLF